MNIYSIYKITNIVNGKVYIGFTSKMPAKERFYQHLSVAFCKNKNSYLYTAIRKYGKESFSFEILYQSTDRYYALEVVEPNLIKEYDSRNRYVGYNIKSGGSCCEHTEETKIKIGTASRNRKRLQETTDKIAAANRGKKRTPEQRAKFRIIALSLNRKKVIKGLFIVTYPDGSRENIVYPYAFGQSVGMPREEVSRLVRGVRGQYKGFKITRIA